MKVNHEPVDETIVSITQMKDGQIAEIITCDPEDIYEPGAVVQRVGPMCVQLGFGSDSSIQSFFETDTRYKIVVKILKNGTRLEVVNN